MFHSDKKKKIQHTKETTYSLHNINFVSRGFKEQREKLVRLLLYTTENVEEKTKPGYILYPLSNSRVQCGIRSCSYFPLKS